VLGSGVSGILHIQLAKALEAATVISTDVNEHRIRYAHKFGADEVFDGKDDVNALAREANGGRGFDHVIVSTAALPAIKQGIQSVEDGGTILLFAPTRPGIELPLDLNDLWSRQVTLTTTYAASPDDLAEALEMIREKKVDVGNMVTHRLGLDETGEGFRIVAEAGDSLKVVVEPQR